MVRFLLRRVRIVRVARVALSAFVLVAIVIGMAAPSFAAGGQTGNLNGTVIDQDTKAPVAGAVVSAASPIGSYRTKTDAHGFFAILGMPVDTYVVSVESPGYEVVTLSGVTIQGDQTLNLGNEPLRKELRTIARVTSRSTTGAFQPTQTIDSYSISGNRILQTEGKEAATNENNLLLAAPGVTLTNAGAPTVRGGSAREVGYEYDGVRFTEPFLFNNGSNGLVSGVGNVQVVEGAGDATQGNVGSGVINVIPKRGTYPGTGFVDFEMGGPNYFHQFAFEYGIATKNNAFSDYISYSGQRLAPYTVGLNLENNQTISGAPAGQNTGPFLNYFNTANQLNDQFTNNFVFKFGKNQNQSLQILYTNISQQYYGNLGGIPPGVFNPTTNPNALAYYPYDTLSQGQWIALSGLTAGQYASLINLGPGVPGTNVAITSPQQNVSLQTRFLKFEYDNNFNADTYMALRYYNWEQLDFEDNSYSNGPPAGYSPLGGAAITSQGDIGGPVSGVNLDLTHQFGSKLTATVNGQYNLIRPLWDDYEPQLGIGVGYAALDSQWLPGGYVYNAFGGNPPRIPGWGINYEGVVWQEYGTGLRLQYNPINPLKFDLGVRYEGQNQHWVNQLAQYGQGPPTNPFDVQPSTFTNASLHPTEIEPRAGVTYLIDANDSVRLGYGRSAVFSNAQTGGTPFWASGLQPYLNTPPIPAALGGPACGIATVQSFPCPSLAAQLYWAGDAVEAPDTGEALPAIYSNYDASYQHQFRNGWGLRVTPFYKLGTDLPSASLIQTLPGGSAVFGVTSQGFNRTTGVELNLTTPDRPVGFSGFLSATYQNVLSAAPPLTQNETNLPLLTPASIALNDIYRAGYVSPFTFRIGGTYNFKNGFSVTPDLQFNVGYPYSVGNLIAATVGPGMYANVPNVNFGPAVGQGGTPPVIGIEDQTGTNLVTNYYDPAFPGNAVQPNIAATRGTPGTSATGGILSPANLEANLTLQYKRAGNTFGVQFLNLFGNGYINSIPAVNPFYQPVATGLSGPLTGTNTCTAIFGTARGCSATIPTETYYYKNGAYLLSNGNFTGVPSLAPLMPFAVQVYYQRAL